jgi:formate-dependent nitrite reductase membrane component NrfD
LLGVTSPALALIFLALTTGLLVFDLKRPDRFHYILLKGNSTSWLVKGAWILMAYGFFVVLWLLGAAVGAGGLLRLLAIPVWILAAAAAGYSAVLFGQAEGRDFWQSPLLLPQLLLAALIAGGASLMVVGFFVGASPWSLQLLGWLVGAGLAGNAIVLFAELAGTHANLDVARTARLITRGRLNHRFWIGAVGLGIAAPLLLLAVFPAGHGLGLIAAVLALVGLWMYEDVWIKAGQSVPLS